MSTLPEARPEPDKPTAATPATAAPASAGAWMPRPERVTLPATAPAIDELFAFMRDAERRFRSLRMRIADRRETAAGPVISAIELWLRHPERAKVITTTEGEDGRSIYEVWLSDGEHVRTYDSATNVATVRPHRRVPEGIDDPQLPDFARVHRPVTELPMESLPEAFIHPHGLTRNVLASGPVTLVGQTRLAGREALLLEARHPRTAHWEGDRPDRTLLVGVDRETGVIVLLEERVGEVVTRRAEVTHLEPETPIADETFTLHVPADAQRIF